jgi:hypothetical protein
MSKSRSFRLLFELIIANGLLLLFHITYVLFKTPLNSSFFIENDHSFGEYLGYLQEVCIITLLLLATFSRKQFLYLAWAILFLYLAIDDSFQVHETLGLWLSQQFGFSSLFGLRAQDLGELMALAVPYGLLILFVVINHFRADKPTKGISRALLPMLGLLVFFGVFVDMLHVKLSFNLYLDRLAGFIEDGGEMVVLGLTLYRLVQWLHHSKPRQAGLPKQSFAPLMTSVTLPFRRK